MIVFLTLCYVAVLALFVKLGVIKLTMGWKLSPLIWMLLLLFVLFLPMQWGAPSGDLLVVNYVVEIIPNVSGEVISVDVDPLETVKKGDALFRIDPRPFQAEVDRLAAALAAAEQNVPQLKATYDSSVAAVEQSVAQRDLAKLNFDRAVSIQTANAGAVSELQVDQSRQALYAAEAGVKLSKANQEQALLAWKAEIDGENTAVAELKAQLRAAELNLEWTTVRAPSDGTVVNSFLRPGQRVANFPVRSWMAFQASKSYRVAVAVPQYVIRHIEPGQPVDVVMKLRPGKTLSAKVDKIAPINSTGQIQATGMVPQTGLEDFEGEDFAVVLEFEKDDFKVETLPGGAFGSAAIYTDNVKATHVIRKVMMRMKTWMNYILP